jgi:hypothetical protein
MLDWEDLRFEIGVRHLQLTANVGEHHVGFGLEAMVETRPWRGDAAETIPAGA